MLTHYYRKILLLNMAHYELRLLRLRIVRTQLRSRLSTKRRIMALFAELWKHHPKTGFPCNTTAYPNQCAIRMGTAFVGAGLDIKKLKLVTCDYHPKSAGHTLRALQFAEGLARGVISNIGRTEIHKVGAPGLRAIKVEQESFSFITSTIGKGEWAVRRTAITSISGNGPVSRTMSTAGISPTT